MKIFPAPLYLSRYSHGENNPYSLLHNRYWSRQPQYFYKLDMYFYTLELLEPEVKLRSSQLRSYTSNKNLLEVTQFMKILKRHGLMVKYWLLIKAMLVMHRHFFESVNTYFNTLYFNYMGFHLYAINNQEFFDLDFLLTYVTSILNPCIQLKVVKLPKFLQKKYRKKYDFKVKHVAVNLRKRYVYKRLVVYSGFVNYRKLLDRVYSSIVETFLSPNTNPLHKERINFYKHSLKLYRFGRLNLHAL